MSVSFSAPTSSKRIPPIPVGSNSEDPAFGCARRLLGLSDADLSLARGGLNQLSDPARRRMIAALAGGGAMSVKALKAHSGCSSANTSAHLRELRRAGLVEHISARYRLCAATVQVVARYLDVLITVSAYGRSRAA